VKASTPELRALLATGEYVYADLWTITLNGGQVLRWAGVDVDIVANGQTFVAGPAIDRGAITEKIGFEVATLLLNIDAGDEDLVNETPLIQFIGQRGLDGANVKLERAFRPDWQTPVTGTVIRFAGRVTSVGEIKASHAEVTVSSWTVLLNVNMPPNLYQTGCLHTVYDAGCGLDPEAFAASGTISAGGTVFGFGSGVTGHAALYPIRLSGKLDADPSAIASDFLTNVGYGLPGWTSGLIGDLADWSLYARAANLLLSPVIDSQRQASDFLTEITDATNTSPFWSEGVQKFRPRGDSVETGNGVTWTPDLTPIYDLTEDDFSPADGDPPVVLNILDQSDAYNIVQVEWLDRSNQYNTAIQPDQDLDNIITYGPRKQDPTSWHSICDAAVAAKAATLLKQRTLYIRRQFTFQLPWDFVLLEPTDLVTLTTTTDGLRLNRQLVRILEIDEDEDGLLTFLAEEMIVGASSAALYAGHSGDGYAPNYDAAPGSVTSPVLINAPTSLTGTDPEVWCAAASTSDTWGGCNVWISTDGTSYTMVGAMNGPARYGVLTAALPSHADPDSTNTLSVDLSGSLGTLLGGTASDLAAAATLSLVGDELVAYQDADLTAAFEYDLSPLRRGLYGTPPAAHSIGARFVRLDDAIFKFGYTGLNVGSTIYVKLPSFNIYGRATEDLADVTAFTVDLAPATSLPDEVTGLALAHDWNGSTLAVVCDASARAESYSFKFYAADETTLLREVVTTTPSASYTASLAAQDGIQRAYAVEVIASNAAGNAAPSSWLTVTNDAPAAVTTAAIPDAATTIIATCDASTDTDVAGYILFYSPTSGFDPSTTGYVVTCGIPSIPLYGLATGTYYGRLAAYDGWSADPAFLNLSSEITFHVTTGGGSTPSGGGAGGGGGGGWKGGGGHLNSD
jgi:hypothetical protein